jgi:hypothetical protein
MSERDTPNRMLEFLTTPPRPDGEASRANRRRSSKVRVELSFVGERGWKTTKARLRDIGRGGAALVAREVPPAGSLVRMRIIEAGDCPWVEGRILAAEPLAHLKHRVRVRFIEPCPSFFLGLAVLDRTEPAEQEAASSPWACPNPWVAAS